MSDNIKILTNCGECDHFPVCVIYAECPPTEAKHKISVSIPERFLDDIEITMKCSFFKKKDI